MLDEIITHPHLGKYLTSFRAGQIVFLEGDDAQDLYILASGQLDILKGNVKIAEITERGSLFGEMSFLLGSKRTATIRAKDDVTAIRIPKEEVKNFLQEFPNVAEAVTRDLARRLDETSQILYGLKEFCDQLPDAVILTDRKGKILTWNSAAEKLYGRGWTQMKNKSVEQIYEEPEAYRSFIEEVEERYAVREKILKVKHPQTGTRFISTSTTLLYDGQHNCQGVLSLGRDVTAVKNLERRYQRARAWMVPFLILLFLFAGGAFFGYSYVIKQNVTLDTRQQDLENLLAKDCMLLKSLLAEPYLSGDRAKTHRLMKEFFDIQPSALPYNGLVLLDRDKKVFDAYAPKEGTDPGVKVGSSYGGISFQGNEKSLHRVLIVYRASKEHPMGAKGLELAFKMIQDNQFLGWLVFQMDVDLLKKAYGIDEEGLKEFHFQQPSWSRRNRE